MRGSDAQRVHDRAMALQWDADLAAVVTRRDSDRERSRRGLALPWRRSRRQQGCLPQPVPAGRPLG